MSEGGASAAERRSTVTLKTILVIVAAVCFAVGAYLAGFTPVGAAEAAGAGWLLSTVAQ